MSVSQNVLARMSRSLWELNTRVKENSGDFSVRRDLLLFYNDIRLYLERKHGVDEDDRSFLLMQEKEASCVFLLHGAGGSPREMRELGECLFHGGYTVFAPRMALEQDATSREFRKGLISTGSGGGRVRLPEVISWGGVLADVQNSFEIAREYDPNVVPVGFSFGGAVCYDLARRYGTARVVLLAPAIFPRINSRYALYRLLKRISRGMARRIVADKYVVVEFIENLKNSLTKIGSRMLVIQAKRDPIVSRKSIKVLEELSTDENSSFVLLNSSRHVIVNGVEGREVCRLCIDFLKT